MGLRGRGETAERTRRNGDVAASDAELDSTKWGYSSAGRAPALQAGGRRFDPDYLHHLLSFGKKKVSKENLNDASRWIEAFSKS